jgi:hypothetical protein
VFEINNNKLLSDMVALLVEPNYYDQGYVKTADIAKAMGVSIGVAYSKLNRDQRFEKLIDKSRQAWWRMLASEV